MNNRGVTQHIEMIIATVLFITFFFFIFVFVKPYDTDVLSESLVDGLKYGLEEKVGTEVVHLFVSLGEPVATSFSFDLPKHLEDKIKNFDFRNCKAFDLEGNNFGCYVQNMQRIEVLAGDTGGYNILFSDQIDPTAYFNSQGNHEVVFGGDFTQEVYSYNLLVVLKDKYENDYDSLKTNLRFPESYDFSLTSEIINMTKDIPNDVEVLGKEFVEEVLYPNGTIINERFLIKIW